MAIRIVNESRGPVTLPPRLGSKLLGRFEAVIVPGALQTIIDALGGAVPEGLQLFSGVADALISYVPPQADTAPSVLDKDLATPPGGPARGDRYLVAAGAGGAWAGHVGELAEWDGDSWFFVAATDGLRVFVEDEDLDYQFNAGVWAVAGGGIGGGLTARATVRATTVSALPANTRTGNVLTASANGALPAIDGVSLLVGERLLVKDEATGANNGIYVVTALGDAGNPWRLTRATDADESAKVVPNLYVPVAEGATEADSAWLLSTNAPITLNTTALVFIRFSLVPYGLVGEVVAADAGAAAAGTSGRVSRADHKHPVTVGTPVAIGQANAPGAATALARADHVHEGKVAQKGTVQTTDATPTAVWTLALADNRAYAIRATVVARRTGAVGRYVRELLAFRDAGGAATIAGGGGGDILIPSPDIEQDVTWSIAFIAVGNNLELRVTGSAAQTIRWNADVEISETT